MEDQQGFRPILHMRELLIVVGNMSKKSEFIWSPQGQHGDMRCQEMFRIKNKGCERMTGDEVENIVRVLLLKSSLLVHALILS